MPKRGPALPKTPTQVGEKCAELTRHMLWTSSDRAGDAVAWYRGFMHGLGLPPDAGVEQVIERGIAAVEAAPSAYDSAIASLQATLDAMPSPLDLIPGVRAPNRLSDDICGHCGHRYIQHVGTICTANESLSACVCRGFSSDHSGLQRA